MKHRYRKTDLRLDREQQAGAQKNTGSRIPHSSGPPVPYEPPTAISSDEEDYLWGNRDSASDKS